jgi:hypothetical protein
MENKMVLIVLALALSACGGGGEGEQDTALPFPRFLFNFGNVGNSDFWSSAGCEGRNLRIAFGSSGGCAMRDDQGCNEMPQGLDAADCSWQTQGVGIVAISHDVTDINNLVCLGSIAEIRRGSSNDVFFGRPSYGFGHLTATACEFRRTSGPM